MKNRKPTKPPDVYQELTDAYSLELTNFVVYSNLAISVTCENRQFVTVALKHTSSQAKQIDATLVHVTKISIP